MSSLLAILAAGWPAWREHAIALVPLACVLAVVSGVGAMIAAGLTPPAGASGRGA